MDSTLFDGLDPETANQVIDNLATEIRKRGLEVPAVMALESHKPIGNVLSQMSIAFAPFLVPFFGYESVNKYGQLFSSQKNIEQLIHKIEVGTTSSTTEQAGTCNT